MTESGTGAPASEPTFESLENDLQAAIRQLEDAAVPLEERLRLHAGAVSLHKRLEAALEAARQATSEAARPERAPGDPADPAREPYEAVRDRLAEVVNALESDGLPLARVVELHGEAQRLAARCEAILDGAQERIQEAAGAQTAAPTSAGDGQDDG